MKTRIQTSKCILLIIIVFSLLGLSSCSFKMATQKTYSYICEDENCSRCHGTGEIGLCAACQGRGQKIIGSSMLGDQPEICRSCNGAGRIRCGY